MNHSTGCKTWPHHGKCREATGMCLWCQHKHEETTRAHPGQKKLTQRTQTNISTDGRDVRKRWNHGTHPRKRHSVRMGWGIRKSMPWRQKGPAGIPRVRWARASIKKCLNLAYQTWWGGLMVAELKLVFRELQEEKWLGNKKGFDVIIQQGKLTWINSTSIFEKVAFNENIF